MYYSVEDGDQMENSMSDKIRALIEKENSSIVELCYKLNKSQSNMSNQLKRDNFSTKLLAEIAKEYGYRFEGYFVDGEGNRI